MLVLVAAMLDLLLLIPSPEANEKYTRNFPPYYYVCDNRQTLVSRLEYEDQMGTGELLSVYPYPIEERQQVLWITKGRQYIVVDGQEHDCKSLGSPSWLVPHPAALKEYSQRFKASHYSCEGDHKVVLRTTDFFSSGYYHGVMQVDDREQVGMYFTRGTSGSFNGRALHPSHIGAGSSLDWGVRLDDDNKRTLKWFLTVDGETHECNRLE